jgi:hypothetical protein
LDTSFLELISFVAFRNVSNKNLKNQNQKSIIIKRVRS